MIDRDLYSPACFFFFLSQREGVGRAIEPPQIIMRAICASAACVYRGRKLFSIPSNGGACGKLIVTRVSNVPSRVRHPCKTRPFPIASQFHAGR